MLAEIERRTLGKATRLTPGQFGGEVAKAIALLDRDAAGRLRRARESRRVWVRQLEDGMGYFAMTHEWPVVEAIMAEVRADGRALQLARRAAAAAADAAGDAAVTADGSVAAEPDEATAGHGDADPAGPPPTDPDQTTTGSVGGTDDEDDATADACRADAFAARVLGQHHEDGSVTWDRSEVDVVVNVVIDLDTLRGEADRVALLDGQPVPGEIGREVAKFGSWWRRLVTDPVDGHLIDFGRAQYLPEKLRRFVFSTAIGVGSGGPRWRLPHPVLRRPRRVPAADGPRRRVAAGGEQRGEHGGALHHVSPAQDRRLRRHHRQQRRRLLHVAHRMGTDHPRPTPTGPRRPRPRHPPNPHHHSTRRHSDPTLRGGRPPSRRFGLQHTFDSLSIAA